MNDASIGAWLIEVLSDIGDNLNYHIDKTFQETSIDSASEPSSIRDIARTNGYKIPYKKNGNECFLCFIVDENRTIIGGLNFDKSIRML
jgi:hypothetical protein